MDFTISTDGTTGAMAFDKAGNIFNNIYLSLMIDKGSFFFNPEFGSRLYLLKRAKNTEKTAALAREYCKEALQWLIDTGRAVSVEATSQRDRTQVLDRLKVLITVAQSAGRQITFETFVSVGGNSAGVSTGFTFNDGSGLMFDDGSAVY